MKWAEWFPFDLQGNESEFKQKLNLLNSGGIQLPENYEFYSTFDDDCIKEKNLFAHLKEDYMSNY